MRLLEAMRQYAGGEFSRFHMPGHKGISPDPGALLLWEHDLTEVRGLDSLYEADGPIRETERAYAALYGSRDCVLSAGGSTLCIQGMLATALRPGDALLVFRGCHVAAVRAMALLDLAPIWMSTSPHPVTGLAPPPSPQEIEAALLAHPEARAVYLTSPTYFGTISEIGAIAPICHKHGVPLLVDNAHGAHLAFLEENRHPMAQGADLCADSLHKTLPVLTGGALLHIGNEKFLHARDQLALFGSTSPSYLIMGSADLALGYLQTALRADLEAATRRLEQTAQRAKARGFFLGGEDPIRLSLGTAPLGYTGEEFADHLRACLVEPEYAGGTWCVLMASPALTERDYQRLEHAIQTLPARDPLPVLRTAAPLPKQKIRLRDAVFARCERVPVAQAVGRVAGDLVAPCPPGIALCVAGEEIDSGTAALLAAYGIEQVSVLI